MELLPEHILIVPHSSTTNSSSVKWWEGVMSSFPFYAGMLADLTLQEFSM